ncbi:unnamed protein product [Mytilus coruscus]|uniref:TRPM SLOG domain-containing protein n=1 Tax=Mytilus coruscus TaxID=42192 RepID=A0A6J8A0S6_MYTCO|nr:unnamed protein product [Mytilus coruscus]
MMDSQTEILMKTLTDQGEKIEELHQLLRRMDLHAGAQRKGNKTAIHVPAHIKQAVRDAYRHSTTENNLVWTCKTAAGSILKYSSGENKELSEAICVYVKGQYPTTEEGVIKTGIETYFNTIKQRRQMEEDGKKASHNRKMVLYGRKNRKLQNRVKALQAKKLPSSEEDKLMKAMKIDFMSSEDSDSEDETRLITRPLTWLSKDFKSYMDKLDSKYQRQLNAQGKKLRSKRVVGRPSERPCPKKSPDLAWYTQIPDTVDQSHLLRGILPKQWNVSPPDAIIAITGISHQFNIKNKRNLKKDLIEAVKSTGSWIVTCGTECGVVKFIEDAVNEHVTLTEYNIPIVGLLSEGVLDEIEPLKRFIHGKEKKYGKSIIIPVSSTKESLDPNHTQFIFLGDPDMKHLRGTASSECRNAFQRFLSNIKDADFKTKIFNDKPKITEHDTYSKNGQCETNEILPVVLVLIEGGIDALETVLSVLENNNHVVVIDGSGGAANFLSTCYQLVTRFT